MSTDPEKIERREGRGVVVRGDDVDTDRIIPARYMKSISFAGLEEYVFADARRTQDGTLKDHPFNEDRFEGASVLVVNKNFGCGSSREHAPQALMRWGICAIVGESLAEIFLGNCTAIGCRADKKEARTCLRHQRHRLGYGSASGAIRSAIRFHCGCWIDARTHSTAVR